jgi:hypothetical protein
MASIPCGMIGLIHLLRPGSWCLLNRFTLASSYKNKASLLHRCFLVLMLWCCASWAEETRPPTYLPARFGTGSESLLAKLECPSKSRPSKRTVVFCQAYLRADGAMAKDLSARGQSFCFSRGFRGFPGFQGNGETTLYEDEDYVEATDRALRNATFLPASVNDKAVPVRFSFHVVFDETEGCVVTAYPNLGFQTAELGLGHVAPQEILTDGGWSKRSDAPFRYIGTDLVGVIYSMSVQVATDGRASDGKLDSNFAGINARATDAAVKALEGSKFIPGFYKGFPYPMRYPEMVFCPPRSR